MPKLIKMTRAGFGDDVWINPDLVTALIPAPDGAKSTTIISFGKDHGIGVNETAEEVAMILDVAKPATRSRTRS